MHLTHKKSIYCLNITSEQHMSTVLSFYYVKQDEDMKNSIACKWTKSILLNLLDSLMNINEEKNLYCD
jgi:hypothetical protein